jgi:hypothetical protein
MSVAPGTRCLLLNLAFTMLNQLSKAPQTDYSCTNPIITLLMLFNRVEVQGELAKDLEPAFPLPDKWLRCGIPQPTQEQSIIAAKAVDMWNICLPNNQQWIPIYHDLSIFSQQTVLDANSDMIISPYTGAWSNAVIHRLLSIRPLLNGETRENVIEEACRIASMVYMVRVWRNFGIFPARSVFLVTKLRNLLSSHCLDWSGLEPLHMWILYTACVEASGENLEFFIDAARTCIALYRVSSWTAFKANAKAVLWIDKAYEALHLEELT